MQIIQTADQAVSLINSNHRVFVQGGAATPLFLLKALAKRANELRNVEIICMSVLGDIAINNPAYSDSFYFNACFVSAPIRKNVNGGNGDYIPVFLSEIHQLFERGILPLDVAMIHVSPPDKHGFCSLGTSVDVAKSAVRNAKMVIAQVNPRMPRTHGDGVIHISAIHAMVECTEELPTVDYSLEIDECALKVGGHVASLIDDGATLQLGIGTIPDAVLKCLHSHRDLGVHTEMFSNGVVELMKKGVITNRYKQKHRYKTTTAFAIGNRELYDYIDDNPEFSFLNASYVNDGMVIRKNPKVVAVNSAIEIDLTGQICADSIGIMQYSGVGGQMDFIRGAALSQGGKPIIAMTSKTAKGLSKIVPMLKEGAGVVTTRAHVHYVVTEYGIANLFGKNLRQRAEALMQIAAPEHQEELDNAIREEVLEVRN
jgi:acyl-CoA hydrolase